jgi:SAM-dependent methyltransferase
MTPMDSKPAASAAVNSMPDKIPNELSASQAKYAQLHQGSDAIARYQRKLSNRIDVLRDAIETDLLSRVLEGSVFDCTIGIGRLIGRLPKVSAYDGMDLSAEFVNHVRGLHPAAKLQTGDLTAGIPVASASYDNVLCLRSLSGIGGLAKILPEMLRVVRPGGLLVFDYGRKPMVTTVKGQRMVLDGEDLEGVIRTLDASVIERVKVDAVLTRAKIYMRVFRFLTGPRGHLVSDAALLAAERFAAPLLWQRQIIVMRRNPA